MREPTHHECRQGVVVGRVNGETSVPPPVNVPQPALGQSLIPAHITLQSKNRHELSALCNTIEFTYNNNNINNNNNNNNNNFI